MQHKTLGRTGIRDSTVCRGPCPVAITAALLVSIPVLLAEVRKMESKEGQERTLVLENESLRLVVFPDLGGRIGHLVDLRDQDDLLYWDLSPTAVYHGEGGALDDRRNSFEPYTVVPVPDGTPAHAVRLVFTQPDITIEKTISLQPGQSSVRVDYVYKNTSQADLRDYNVMTKNWLLPSGGPITSKDLYCLPTSRGVRRIEGYSGNWGQYPDLRGKFQQDVGPWNGMASSTKHRGVAIAFSNDYFRWFYFWRSGAPIATYEWVFGELPAGHQAAIMFWIHVVRGMDGFSFVNRYTAIDLRYDGAAGRLKTAVFAAEAEMKDARIETEARRLPADLPVRLAETRVGAIPMAGVQQAVLDWKPEQPGTYVIRQRLLDGRTILAEFEEPVVVGSPSGEYVRTPLFPDRATIQPVPGWKAVPKKDAVQATDEDKKRGYVVYLDAFASEDDRGRHTSQYTLPMGQEETKSFSLKIRALGELKRLTVSTESQELKKDQVDLFGTEPVDVSDKATGKTGYIGQKLVPWAPTDLAAGEERDVWVRVRTLGTDEGSRSFQVLLAADGREMSRVAVHVQIRPVALPRPNLISLEVEHSTMILPGCWNAEGRRWNGDVVERYVRDLGEHLADFEQGFWGWFGGPRDGGMLQTATTGQPLQEFLKSDPDLASPPPLDFSYLNPVFDAAIRNGLVRFSSNSGGALPPQPVPSWVMREAARYLRDRGYPAEDIWCKNRDEEPATNYPAMAQEVQWLRNNGFRPFSSFHNLLAVPEHLAILNPVFDMFQGGYTTAADRADRRKEGKLDATDEVWMYQGWGATWFTYQANRQPGWLTAATELDGYHVHVYYRWQRLDAIIFPTEQGPEGSPAWEGMRDGMADAQYVALARRWIERVERAAAADASLQPIAEGARQKLLRIVGGEGGSLVPLERKRDRLVWVERVPTLAMPALEKARTAVLDLLADLRPHVAKLGPSLYYGGHVLAENGRVMTCLAPAAHASGATLVAQLLKDRFGVQVRAADSSGTSFTLDLQTRQVPGSWKADPPHVTDSYPPAGEYVIHLVPGGEAKPTRLLIFGRDDAGLEKGIRQWLCFLRTERRGGSRPGP